MHGQDHIYMSPHKAFDDLDFDCICHKTKSCLQVYVKEHKESDAFELSAMVNNQTIFSISRRPKKIIILFPHHFFKT